MPDENGKLSQEDLEYIIDKLNKWGGLGSCDICKQSSWNINSHIFSMSNHSAKGILSSRLAYPTIPINCNNCGNTRFLSAVVSGLVELPSEDSGGEKDAS